MQPKISTHTFINVIESNQTNNPSIFSEIITIENLTLSYHIFLEKLMNSSYSPDQELFVELTEFSPKKQNKYLRKLQSCMILESFSVTDKKESYRNDSSWVGRIYSDKVRRLHNDPVAKRISKYKGLLFRKIEESSYLSQKHINKLKSKTIAAYPYAYTFSQVIKEMYANISSIVSGESTPLSNIKEFRDLFANAFNHKNIKFNKLNSKKTKEFIENTPSDNYFVIEKEVWFDLLHRAALNILGGKNHSEVTSIQTIKNNIMFEGSDGRLHVNNLSKSELAYLKDNNKYISLDEYGRRYTVLNSIKKNVRNTMFEGRFEYDIDSSALMTLLNIRFSKCFNHHEDNFIKRIQEVYPAIYELICNKKISRYNLAEALGCTYEEAKQLITTLLMDPANRIKFKFKRKREKQVKFAIQLIRELRNLSRVVEYIVFESNEEEVNLHYKFNGNKIKDIRTIVAEDIRISKFKNPKKFGRGKKYFGKKLFRFYAMMENGIRKAMIEYAEGIGSHYNQLHDCIFIDKKISHKDLTDYVRYKTGYIFFFTETIL